MYLNDSIITRTKPDPVKEIRLPDGEGLHVVILPNGRRYWRWDYTFDGRRKQLSFGRYPIVTLEAARRKKREGRWLLSRQIDPSVARRAARHAIPAPSAAPAVPSESESVPFHQRRSMYVPE
jgi:hypothetical protein